MLVLKYFGTQLMPTLFSLKRKIDLFFQLYLLDQTPFRTKFCTRFLAFSQAKYQKKLREFSSLNEHMLILTVKGSGLEETQRLLEKLRQQKAISYCRCNEKEVKRTYLVRFAAAGAAIQFANIHSKKCAGLIALDIALPRNCQQWFEKLPESLRNKIEYTFYYGHFICHLFHQDDIVKSAYKVDDVKRELLSFMESRGAEYPAEHNVGPISYAKPDMKEQYVNIDPTNTFNPGIGKRR